MNLRKKNYFTLVGLGNPEEKYTYTRHNIGFLFLDFLAKEYNLSFTCYKNFLFTSVKFKNKKLFLQKPLTYVNESGLAVKILIKQKKIPFKNLIVIYDDIDLDFGRIKIKESFRSITHNGIKSLVNCLGRKDFICIRLGIKGKEYKNNCAKYVLEKFNDIELKQLNTILNSAMEIAKLLCVQECKAVMNRFNRNRNILESS